MSEIYNSYSNIVFIPIVLPFITALLILFISDRTKYIREFFSLIVSGVCLWASVKIVGTGEKFSVALDWFSSYNISFQVDSLSAFLLLSVSFFSFLISLYASGIKNKGSSKIFYFLLLLTQSASAGVVLSDNLLLLLFFWESMGIFLYLFIYISSDSPNTRSSALKAFLINVISDLAMMVGIVMVYYITPNSTFSMSEISRSKIILDSWGTVSYILILIGALTKAGVFPFHTWIPHAALYSNAAFMAYIPAAIDKLLGIYFLARITVYLYEINTTMQLILMSIGAITILAAVMMALIQKDYKKLLSYHAVSQAGYMVLGIGSLNPVGIAGGLFHMINHATYKSCLFMTAGSVERQSGISDISKLGGLFWNMPITAICYIIAASSISGIAPFNGFFSKELVYKGALMTGYSVFFYAAEIGSILTLASFLKLGHSVFFGKAKEHLRDIKESPLSVLIPMIVLAGVCIVFGFGAHFPISRFIEPSLNSLGYIPTTELSGFHFDNLFLVFIAVVLIALSNHIIGFSLTKEPYRVSDHIHYAPILRRIYEWAERGYFDLYEIFRYVFRWLSDVIFKIDRIFDAVIDSIPVGLSKQSSQAISSVHSGVYNYYILAIFFFTVVYMIYLGGIRW